MPAQLQVILTIKEYDVTSSSGISLLLESGDNILLETGDALLQEAVITTTTGLLMETGDHLLLETGDALFFDESGEPPGPPVSNYALLDVDGGEILDVNGQAFTTQ